MYLIINGPNLNMLGRRDPAIYGSESLHDLADRLHALYPHEQLLFLQSNSEGEIIDMLQKYGHDGDCRGVVINPGAYAHYSYAIADALRDLPVPAVEVHISNIHAREEFRSHSVTARACRGVIAGLGLEGYRLALEHLMGGLSPALPAGGGRTPLL